MDEPSHPHLHTARQEGQRKQRREVVRGYTVLKNTSFNVNDYVNTSLVNSCGPPNLVHTIPKLYTFAFDEVQYCSTIQWEKN